MIGRRKWESKGKEKSEEKYIRSFVVYNVRVYMRAYDVCMRDDVCTIVYVPANAETSLCHFLNTSNCDPCRYTRPIVNLF